MRTGIDRFIDDCVRQNMSTEEIVETLVNNFTTRSITELLVNTQLENAGLKSQSPVRITQADFDRHFRIIGTRSNGEVETRGRKAKKK